MSAANVVLAAWCFLSPALSAAASKIEETSMDRPPVVSLAELVAPDDPLARQDLRFDARFAEMALTYLRTGETGLLRRISELPAAAFLLSHARNFDYPDVPKDSAEALVGLLLAPPAADRAERVATCERSLAFFRGPMLDDPHWIGETLRYLPQGFRFKTASLFLTFGYDIGVAFAPNASLNGASRRFSGHSRELIYYGIHELHHAGFMTYRRPPHFPDLKTCRDLLSAVEYLTQLEGMAVLAAWDRRRVDNALDEDPDYVALQDAERMAKDEVAYFREYDYLAGRGNEPIDDEARAVLERMSGGERLWYRVGALMARRIEGARGRPALVALIGGEPSRFLQTYLEIRPKTPARGADGRRP
jgi:hypothetical protein